MKKILLLITIAVFTSCTSGPQKDGKKICDLFDELVTAKKANNVKKMKEVSTRARKLIDELRGKYKDDKEGEKEVEKIVTPCMEEAQKVMAE